MSTKEQRAVRARINEMLAERGMPAIEAYTTPKLDGPVVAVVTIIPGKCVYDAAAENYDMAAAQARWAAWDRVLAEVLEPEAAIPASSEPIMEND